MSSQTSVPASAGGFGRMIFPLLLSGIFLIAIIAIQFGGLLGTAGFPAEIVLAIAFYYSSAWAKRRAQRDPAAPGQ